MSELEDAMGGRDILSRQKKFAFVRPSAVCLARVVSDAVVSFLITALYMIVVYFLSGLKLNVSSLAKLTPMSLDADFEIWEHRLRLFLLIFCLSTCAR